MGTQRTLYGDGILRALPSYFGHWLNKYKYVLSKATAGQLTMNVGTVIATLVNVEN